LRKRLRRQPWAVIELSPKGEELAKQGILSQSLSKTGGFKRKDVFVPVFKIGRGAPVVLMEGYAFIKMGYDTSKYWDLKQSGFVNSVLSGINSDHNMISLKTVSDKDLKEMISRVDNLGGKYKEGDSVRITNGHFQGLEGEVVLVLEPSSKEDLSEYFVETGTFRSEGLSRYVVVITIRSAEIIVSLDCFSIEGI
jgi:hypothetical protein